jgi:hypothetical protein
MTPAERDNLLLLHPVVSCECVHDCQPRVHRFFDFILLGPDGCWLWTGGKAGGHRPCRNSWQRGRSAKVKVEA